MPNNLFANRANLVHGKSTQSFVGMGFTGSNVEVIFQISSSGLKSWKPNRAINAITAGTVGGEYYIVAKTDMDKTAYFNAASDIEVVISSDDEIISFTPSV